MDDDSVLYQIAADELNISSPVSSLWARALAESDGNTERTKSRYITLRVAQLKKDSKYRPHSLSGVDDSKLIELRIRIDNNIKISRRLTLYKFIGSNPTATDQELTQNISRVLNNYKERGVNPPSEIRYAVSILGDPNSRLEYDKKLWDEISIRSRPRASNSSGPIDFGDREKNSGALIYWWQTKKTSALLLGLFILSILFVAINFFEKIQNRDTEKGKIDVLMQAAQSTEKIEARRIEAQKSILEGHLGNQSKIIDNSAQLENRRVGIDEERERRFRKEQENRAALEAQRLELHRKALEQNIALQKEASERRRQAVEDRRIQGEKRYWSCMNARMERGYSSARANEFCQIYRAN